MSGLKWPSLTQSYTRCLIGLLILQTSQILGEDQDEFNIGYTWIRQDMQRDIAVNAFQGGYIEGGSAVYVGRGLYNGDLLPAKVVPAYKRADVSYNNTVYTLHEVDVLVLNSGKLEWVGASDGYVPHNAIIAGRTATGEALYAGRTDYSGSKIVGKIQPSHRCLYICFGFVEQVFFTYEVLVYNSD